MPIITVQFIKDVVATPEQKRELIVRLTDTFCDILGDVVRPFVYTLIEETPQQEWGIAGVPMPDLVYLTSDKHAQVIGRSNDLMRGAIAQMQAAAVSQTRVAAERADAVWRGTADSVSSPNGTAATVDNKTAAQRADAVWRGMDSSVSSNGASNGNYGNADAVWRGTADSVSASNGKAQEHRRLFTRWFEELWNKKNYSVAYELVDPDFTAHGAGGQDIKQGPDGVVGMVKAWHAAMPDGRMTIDDIITEGDLSTIRMTWEATHTGKFGDIPASNKRIKVTSIGIDRVINGKITEGWGELNMLGMLQQMGAIPSPS
jgi:4-oxalocrotonate tautomerase family enzyme